MEFIKRQSFPKFQERLDLASSELNDSLDLIVATFNELFGRLRTIYAMIPADERSKYSSETSFPILDTLDKVQENISKLSQSITEIRETYDAQIRELNSQFADFEERLNALDDAAARKEDLNVILFRTGE